MGAFCAHFCFPGKEHMMINEILLLLKEHGIHLSAPISLRDCEIIRGYKLERAGFGNAEDLTAIMIAIPYLTPHHRKNLSSYAAGRDYHGYFDELFSALIPLLRERYPNNRFAGFADDSPINERNAAAMAGLGIIGDNGMLITEKYSSYVFLGEIITDIPTEVHPHPVSRCIGCGACKMACPMGEIGICLSALTQKKGTLTENEEQAIKKFGSVWGCDICQEVCPYTKKAIESGTIYSDIEYFKKDLIPYLTHDDIDKEHIHGEAERLFQEISTLLKTPKKPKIKG